MNFKQDKQMYVYWKQMVEVIDKGNVVCHKAGLNIREEERK